MDLDLTDDQELLRETTAKFVASTCPLPTVRELADSPTGLPDDYLARTADLGWYAMLVPEEFGGGSVSGDGLRDAAIVAEERGRALQPGPFVPMNVVAFALAEAGSDAQRAEVLPAIVGGELAVTWALAPDSAAFAPASVRCSAAGDGFTLSGVAGMVQDAHLAQHLLVTASSPDGPTQFLVPADTPGVQIEQLDSLDLTRRFARVRFDDVAVDATTLVGTVAGAADLLEHQLDVAAVLTVAESVGAMDENFTVALDYAKVRTAFGRPIGSFQAVKHQLADASMLLEASKGLAVGATRAVQSRARDASELASAAKAFVGDSGVDVMHTCWQVYGGIGYTWEHDHHLFLRRLTTDAALHGDPTWHRERMCRIHEL